MIRKHVSSIVAGLLAGLVVLTGCSASQKISNAPSNSTSKPVLVVPPSFSTPGAKVDFAVKAVSDGYFPEAQKLLEESVKTSPDAHAYGYLGTARYNTGDLDGAIEAWKQAAKLNPKLEGEMQNNVGNALRDSRRIKEAEAAFRKALELNPTQWVSAINLATMLKTNGEVNKAIEVLQASSNVNKEAKPLQSLLSSFQTEAKGIKNQ